MVDDGSTDDSYAEAKMIMDKHPNCRIVRYNRNRGRGYALRQGFRIARGDYIITTESDLSWGTDIIQRLYNKINSNISDIVIASTYLPGGKLENSSSEITLAISPPKTKMACLCSALLL